MKTLTSIDHWGILLLTSWQLDLQLLTMTLWTSWPREFFCPSSCPPIQCLLSLKTSMLWKTVLKALLKSKQLASTDSPWSTEPLISSEGSQVGCTWFAFSSLCWLIPVTFMSIVPGNSFPLGLVLGLVQRMRWDWPLSSSLILYPLLPPPSFSVGFCLWVTCSLS